MGTLQGTMTKAPTLVETGNVAKDLDSNISSLSSQYNPGSIADFSEVAREISQLAYQTRQTAEHAQLDRQFDPTKVSGGTFSDIMGFVEKNRGADISKIAVASVQGEKESQRQIGGMLESLKNDRNQLRSNARAFKFEMASKYPGIYNTLSDDEKQSIDNGDPSTSVFAKFDAYASAAKAKEDAWEAEKRAMQRLSYQKTTNQNARLKELNEMKQVFVEGLIEQKGLDGFNSPEDVRTMNLALMKNFPDLYDTNFGDLFLTPKNSSKSVTELRYEEDQLNKVKAKDEYINASESMLDKRKGLANIMKRDKPELDWQEFIGQYPQLSKDMSMANEVRRGLEAKGYKII